MTAPSARTWLNSPGCLIEASAGAGKTTRVINEMLTAIRAGGEIRRIAAVTFTHQAAGEMKLRLRQQLERCLRSASTPPDERERIQSAITRLEEAYIGTIHGFCAHLLRQRPVEAGLDPAFREISALESYLLFNHVFRSWLEGRLRAGSRVLDAAFCRMSWRIGKGNDPVAILREEAWKLCGWRDFDGEWARPPFARSSELEALLDRLAAIVARWKTETEEFRYLKASLYPAAELGDKVPLLRETTALDPVACEAELCSIVRRSYSAADFKSLGPQRHKEWDAFLESAAAFAQTANAAFAAELHAELLGVVARYQKAKTEAGLVDFEDLLLRTRDLMRNNATRRWFQQQFDHLFIDEFQDTDPIQAEILMLLAANDPAVSDWREAMPAHGKLFVVGDPKQSIYRFRRAEVALYNQIAGQLIGSGAFTDPLASSERSVLPIQEFVNSAFEPRMPGYLPLTGGREGRPGQPGIVALPVPEPFGKTEEAKWAIKESAPRAVAAFIRWLLDTSDWSVFDRQTREWRAVQDTDVCILFRRFTADITNAYVRSLEAHNLRHVLIGSKSFRDREEVGTLCAALRAIEDPHDDLYVYATLRGSLFAIDDVTLYHYREASKNPQEPVDDLEDALSPDVDCARSAVDIIWRLHQKRNRQPVTATINDLLAATRAHAGFALRPGGERVLANVYRVIDLARRYEISGATSFRSFIDFLEDEATAGEAGEAPLLEHDAEGVKLMTVHKAKGLEFPVVILADPSCGLVREGGGRYLDFDKRICAQSLLDCAPWDLLEHGQAESAADRAEADRLAYVAATRARDLLVVTALGTMEWTEGWLSPLLESLYPVAVGSPARAYEKFSGKQTHIGKPEKGAARRSLAPGWHRPRAGRHEVLWIDPLALAAQPASRPGISDVKLLQGDPKPGFREYKHWSTSLAEAVQSASIPTRRIEMAAATKRLPDRPAVAIETIRVAPASARASDRLFGRLVHAILQDAPFTSGGRDGLIGNLSRSHSRRLGLPDKDARAAAETVAALLDTPPLQAAAKARRVLRECPFVLRGEEGSVIAGNIDLAFFDDSGWTIVDYKTGRADRREYERQIEVYALALAADGVPVRGVLLEIG